MTELIRGYGKGLVAVFFAAVGAWALLLILLPQFTLVDQSLRSPLRQLDSNIADTLAIDAGVCISNLERYAEPADTGNGVGAGAGLAIPSPSTTTDGGIAAPSPGTMAVPSPGTTTGGGAARPYILQCDRSTTSVRVVRGDVDDAVLLRDLYDLPDLAVDPDAPLDTQVEQAAEIRDLAAALAVELRAEEASAFPYDLGNYEALFAARAIPMEAESRAEDDADLANQLYGLIGLRYVDENDVVHKRLGAITLVRTIFFAICATALALIVCYPIAYNLALASDERKAVWLLVGLIIPYAIVELMRVYAWLSIIDNNGLLNQMLAWMGAVDLEEGGIAFKRYPLTVFVVVVYTYILFMVFPIVNVMSTLDKAQVEAARDLGAAPWRVHARVIIPHTKPGIAVGCITTFMLSAGAFSVPRIISRGLQGEWFSQTIYNKFFESGNSNVGAAYTFAYMLICFVIVGLFMWAMRARLKDFVRA